MIQIERIVVVGWLLILWLQLLLLIGARKNHINHILEDIDVVLSRVVVVEIDRRVRIRNCPIVKTIAINMHNPIIISHHQSRKERPLRVPN